MVMKAPGNTAELGAAALEQWTNKLSLDFREEANGTRTVPDPDQDRAWFFDPTTVVGLEQFPIKDIKWTAFPKKLKPSQGAQADANRDLQEEYCEWEVVKKAGRLVRITFTTETQDYYDFLWKNDQPKLLELYRRFVSPAVRLEDLKGAQGDYNPRNAWNLPTMQRGTIMHMAQGNNTLRAAMNLTARATWPIVDESGVPITSEQGVIAALRFGDPARHSDPHIGAQINELVRGGNEVSFADPVGLYIEEIDLADIKLPDGKPATDLMRVTRGAKGFMLRVVFEAPSDASYDLEAVMVDGKPLKTGSQMAERIRVRIRGAAKPTDQVAPQLQLPGLNVVGSAAPAAGAAATAARLARLDPPGSVRAHSSDGVRSPELDEEAPLSAEGGRTAIVRSATPSQLLPMRIQVLPGSLAEHQHYAQVYEASSRRGDVWASPLALTPGIAPSPASDLIFRGGKVVAQMAFQNVYLGGQTSWKESDVTSIDKAIDLAMRDKRLNDVMKQYFTQAMDCNMHSSFVHPGQKLARLEESDVQGLVVTLFDSGALAKTALDSCIFNLILPRGTTLALGNSNSLEGLGGYHGSVHIMRQNRRITLYYSANVYSASVDSFRQNGIVAFDQPWKNVVATLYHELNEFRTDPDVNDAIQNSDNGFCGWTSQAGQEVGDQPIFKAAGNLNLVFKEIQVTPTISLPIQFMYSNRAHGAEGPDNN